MKGLLVGMDVCVVAPANQAAMTMPLRLFAGMEWLRAQGARVQLMPSAASGVMHPSPAARADDLMRAMTRPGPGVVAAAVGGNGSIGVLREIARMADEWHEPGASSRILHGGSDVTTLLWWAHHRYGTRASYGTGIALGLAEQPVRDVTAHALVAAWLGRPATYTPKGSWTEEEVPFNAPLDAPISSLARPDTGPVAWRALQTGTASGLLLPGCLEVLVWWLRDQSCWSLLRRGPVILALDIALSGSRWGSTSMGGPTGVDALLHSFGLAGGWDNVAAVVVGRPRGYLDHEREHLDEVLLNHVPKGLPLLVDVDLGHTEPSLSLPLGVRGVVRTEPPALEVGPIELG